MNEEKIDVAKIRVEEAPEHGSHGHHRHHKHKHRHRKPGKLRILLWILLLLLGLLAAAGVSAVLLYRTGKSSMQTEEPESLIEYQGSQYRYRTDSVNILLIGVDSSGTNGYLKTQGGGNGQSDVIVLANMNLDDKKLTLIPINRDTMTQVAVQNENGEFVRYEDLQLALSYAYGINSQDSARLTMDAVSHLFYELPIQGYFTVNISGISLVNDLVGGVDLVLTEDYVEEWGDGYFKGATIHIQNTMAEDYIRTRHGKADGTNTARMERQKAYFIALAKKVLAETRKNPTLPIRIYQQLERYMTTDIDLKEATYLASNAVACGFSEDSIRRVEGTLNTENEYAEFYTDDQALYEMILDVFYEKVN